MSAVDNNPVSCYILHRRPFRESSVILDIVAPGKGLLAVVLRGAQGGGKGKSIGNSALAQPFRPLLMTIKGSGEMKTGYAIEDNGASLSLQDKFLYSGFYINELICRLWPKNVDTDELFDLYRDTLSGLVNCQQLNGKDNVYLEQVLRQFELMLLNLLGFAIDFHYAADTGEVITSGQKYQFSATLGFTGVYAPVQCRQSQEVFDGSEINAIGALDLSDEDTLKAAKRLTRLALAHHLGPKPLKSRELFISMR